MTLSSREYMMGWIVGLLVLLSLSYWFGAPKVRIWRETVESQKQVADRIALSERLIQSQDEWDKRLDALKTKLPKYAADKDVTADYMKILERVAKDNSINLIQRRPQKEKRHGDLYELAIECSWEGNLDGLTRFLFGLEQESVSVDVGDLTVSLVPGGKGRMKGNFTLMCVYSRTGEPPAEVKPTAPKPAPPKSARPGNQE